MTTDADRAKAAELLRSDYSRRYLEDVAAALAAERAAAVADLRARAEAVAEELEAQADDAEHLAEEHRRARNLTQAGVFAGKKVAKRDAAKRFRAAVTDTTGDPA